MKRNRDDRARSGEWVVASPPRPSRGTTEDRGDHNKPGDPLGAFRTEHKCDPERDSRQRVTEIVDLIRPGNRLTLQARS
jgi:hypothetical protein